MRTIGSYRPLPNVLWKLLASVTTLRSPLGFTVLNLMAHAGCGLLLASLVESLLRMGVEFDPRQSRIWANVTAIAFVCHGLLAESVCSAVGLADILVGGATLVFLRVSIWIASEARDSSIVRRSFAVASLFLFLLIGLWSKETMLGLCLALPLLGAFAWRAGVNSRRVPFVGLAVLMAISCAAILTYVALRKWLFPAKMVNIERFVSPSPLAEVLRSALRSLAPPILPDDPLNNPLLNAPVEHRLPTAAGLFFEQFLQMILPYPLRGDYSFPAQLPHGWTVGACAGLSIFLSITGCFLVLAWRAYVLSGARSPSLGAAGRLGFVGLGLFLASYAMISNALVLLPTIRAERLMYVPMLGAVLAVVGGLRGHFDAKRSRSTGLPNRSFGVALGLYVLTTGVLGRLHANDYASDLDFWRATAHVDRPSAKSILNLGIMVGARGDLEQRLRLTRRAAELAPQWPMAHVYLGDTLCRMGELDAAKSPYLRGLSAAPNSKALTSLAVQCIWDHGVYEDYRSSLHEIADGLPESWLYFFLIELDRNGKEHGGLDVSYRSLGYDRAPLEAQP